MDEKASRQMIAAAIAVITGLFVALGQPLDAETIKALATNLNQIAGGLFGAFGVILGIFRMITKTPLVTMFKKAKS